MNFIVLIEEFNNYDTGEERFIVKKVIEYKTDIYETEDDNIDGYVVPSGWKLRDSELIDEKPTLNYASWLSDNSINDTINASTIKYSFDGADEVKMFPSYAVNNTDITIERKQFEPYSPFDYLFSIVKSILLLDSDKKFIINDVDENFEIPLVGIDKSLLNNSDYLVYNYNNTDKYFKPASNINAVYYYSNRIKFYFKTKQINSRFGSTIKFNKNTLRYLTPNVNAQGNIANRIYINSKNDYFEITDFTYIDDINGIQIRDSNSNIIDFVKLVSIGYNFNKLGDLDNLYFVYNNGIVVELFVIESEAITGGAISGDSYGLDNYKNPFINKPVIKSNTYENFTYKTGIIPQYVYYSSTSGDVNSETISEKYPNLTLPDILPKNVIIPINSETYTLLFNDRQILVSDLIIHHRTGTGPDQESVISIDSAFTKLQSFLNPSKRSIDPKISYLIYLGSHMPNFGVKPNTVSFTNSRNTGGTYDGSSILGLRFSIIDDFISKYKITLSKETYKKVNY